MSSHNEWKDKSWDELAEELEKANEGWATEAGRFHWPETLTGGCIALVLAFAIHCLLWSLQSYVERKVAEGQQPAPPTFYYYIPPSAGTSPNPEAKPNSDSFCHGTGCL